MLSTLTQTIKRKLQPEIATPEPLYRTVSFPETEAHLHTQKRSFLQYRDTSRRKYPPRDADHDDGEEEQDGALDSDNEDDRSSTSHIEEESPLLPIFSSAHLNAIPIFTLTHTFREMIMERCDTVLSWDQLRSPQVSQFLVKPIQLEIIANHLNAGTHYALLANSLQFMKEAGLQPANSGTNKTRAMVCELIAIKLLRECNTRELIDALSYDFDPLQGQSTAEIPGTGRFRASILRSVRISCIEIAIRANAKRFLAHPSVVTHLEAIWNGSIVFYAAADSMHRKGSSFPRSYGTIGHSSAQTLHAANNRWTASLYNPKDASLFKLSRLRVPRYRNILSTISFAILLILFLFVNQERSLELSSLEIIFWIWAAGYMLDEVIGFTDQGFSLYIASFWNTFDLGILILLLVHLILRLYSIALADGHDKRYMAGKAYDVLACSAVLLFPRLFSVLDHYRYFSQLIIAFRMMAADMVAIFLLIMIFCSGFLVALTFGFTKGDLTDSPKDVAYALLQMLLGFTPTAWSLWDEFDFLGRTVLITFLFVCHFVVVTILVTVMTNSFMEIVRNANEEHQFLFAVNVISNVKSDALFAYVPPINVIQWLLTPLRFVLPFREYIKLNRTIIKATHFPILWTIYLYEQLILRPRYIENTDLVESRGRVKTTISQRLPRLRREPSIATYRQEAVLEEVFRQPTDTIMRTARSQERRKSSNVVNSWMNNHDDAEPPQEQDRKVVDKLENRRYGSRMVRRSSLGNSSAPRKPISAHSDPHDLTSYGDLLSPRGRVNPATATTPLTLDPPTQHTDADGDDELLTNDFEGYDDEGSQARIKRDFRSRRGSLGRDYFSRRTTSQVQSPDDIMPSNAARRLDPSLPQVSRKANNHSRHARNVSSATIIYNPPGQVDLEADDRGYGHVNEPLADLVEGPPSSLTKPTNSLPARKTTKRMQDQPRHRPMLPSQNNKAFRSTPNMDEAFSRSRPIQAERSSPRKAGRRNSLDMDIISDIGDNNAVGGDYAGALPASFASRMNYMQQALRQSQLEVQRADDKRRTEESEMFGRLMMARMNTLEEGFREVVHEVREGMKQVGSGMVSRQRSPERDVNVVKRSKKFKDRQERPVAGGSGGSTIGSAFENNTKIEDKLGSGRGKAGTNTEKHLNKPDGEQAKPSGEEGGADLINITDSASP